MPRDTAPPVLKGSVPGDTAPPVLKGSGPGDTAPPVLKGSVPPFLVLVMIMGCQFPDIENRFCPKKLTIP